MFRMSVDAKGEIENYAGDAWPLPKEAFSHPRSNGTFATILRSYVRERGLLTLQEALRKMTLMPAQTMEGFVPQMKKKGRLQQGMDADIVVFDPDTISDVGTYQDPNHPAVGVQTLLVNGEPVVTQGKLDLAVSNLGCLPVNRRGKAFEDIISLPELLLFPWTSGRTTPLSVWGPAGTRAMIQELQEAFTVDIVDVLIHSFGRRKDDPSLTGPLDEVFPNGHTRRQERAIVQLHTDGVGVGRVFNRVGPKLAIFSHYGEARKEEVSLVRENDSGPFEFGEDLMTIDIGRQVNVAGSCHQAVSLTVSPDSTAQHSN